MARPGLPHPLTVALWALVSLLAWGTRAGGYGPAFAVFTLLAVLGLGLVGGLLRRAPARRAQSDAAARIGERETPASLLRPEPGGLASEDGGRDSGVA